MADESNQQATTQPPMVIVPTALRQRDPPFFDGTDEQDVEDWLSIFEKVGASNKWDDPSKLQYVSFYLKEVASLWFHNHQVEFNTWSVFKQRIADVFGRPEVRKLRAEQRLRGHARLQGEGFTSYIEDVLDLCKRLNPSMTEADKIKHILKGIDDDAFQMLLAKDPRTVSELATLCQSFDELRKQRVLARRAAVPDEPLAALTLGGEHTTLLSEIKRYVREEVARQLSCLSYLPTREHATEHLAPAIRQVIQEQVSEALPSASQPTPVAAPLSYAAVAATPPRPVPVPAPPPVRAPTMPFPRAQLSYNGNPWRTPDNRPICYFCGYPGHVARLCRRRFAATSAAPRYSDDWFRAQYDARRDPPPQRDRLPGECDPLPDERDRQPAPDYRPYAPRRSASPGRRSQSPMRRRPRPSETEN
uniref:CCHC-type domain-containing protein n=1 Tax=Rhipicephalus pulchellus TaxID=72859 RepID=L7LY16_RHIPC